MRKGLRFGLAALVPVLALAITMGASGSAKRVAPAAVAHAAELGPSCYPGHEFTLFDWIGAFSATSTGTASGNGGSVAWTTSIKVTGNKSNKSGFFANPGSIAGNFSATIHVPGVAHEIHFTSHCISAAELGTSAFALIVEGTVDAQPWYPGDNETLIYLIVTPRRVTAPTLASGSAQVGFEIAHGKTCDTLGHQQYAFGFVDNYTASASLNGNFKGKGSPSVRGRAGLPAGVAPKNQPCPGIQYD
jgi:hypothetical protein